MRYQAVCFFIALALLALLPLLLQPSATPAFRSSSTVSPTSRRVELAVPTEETSRPRPRSVGEGESWVVLLSLQRSGTHWLSHELNRDPCISVLPEILYHQTEKFTWWTPSMRRVSIEGFFKCSVDGEKEIDGKLLPWTLVDYVKQTAQDLQNGRLVRGFNWKVNQAFPEDWANWFKKYSMRHKVRIVFLQRRNDLRRIFSVEANRKIPVYATKDAKEATKVRHEKINLDIKNLTHDLLRDKQKIQQVRHILAQAKEVGIPVLHIFYEDIAQDPANLEKLRGWLRRNSSCPPVELSQAPGWVKLHNGSLSELIENWAEVKEALQENSQWEWMLHD